MIAQNLATNLTTLRKTRKITQGNLAKMSGVPRSTIAHIESGTGNPSLRNLAKLSAALQVGIEEMLAAPRSPVSLLKASEIPVEKRDRGRALLHKLLPDPIPGMHIDRIVLKPGAYMRGVPHLPHTKEYLTVVKGEIQLSAAEDIYVVRRGDVLAFPGDIKHGYRNATDDEAVGISVVVLISGQS